MKLNKIIYGALIGAISLTGCTKDFETVNIDPTTQTDLATDMLFTQTTLAVSGGEYEAWRTNLIYNSQFIQQFASLAWPQGDKYNFDEGYNSALWDAYYGNAIKGLVNLVEKTKESAIDVNYNSAARILKAYAFLRLTDSYGDIPYSQAGKGYTEGIFAPVYDEQKNILADIINELDAAAKAFDASKPFKGDVTSNGANIDKWKKTAYSLMVRAAMRMSRKAPADAEAGVKKAVAGGVFASTEESFYIKHLPGVYANPNSIVLGYFAGGRNELSANSFKFSKLFIDWLKAKNDPRLKILSVVRTGPTNSPTIGVEDDNPAIQKGLQSGTDGQTVNDIATYSQLRSDFADADVPNFMVTYSETMLLLAEARQRNWITTGTVSEYYKAGVRSAIDQLKLYGAPASIFDEAAITAYVNGLTLPGDEAGILKDINEQYYVASFLDAYESHANWRRSGHPQLTPVNFPGNYTNGQIPRRFQYPASENGLNGANLQAAIARQGANTWTTRVWWDAN